MGSGSNRNPLGGFYTQEWDEEAELVAGIKVLHNTNNKRANDLPAYSNTSSMYFKRNEKGEIVQLRIYDKHNRAAYDIDINPERAHDTHGKTIMPAGVTHIHEWKINKKGELVRGKTPRHLTPDEIKQLDSILKQANANVRYK